MFNRDGSEGMMCGNGIRCVAKYLYDTGIAKKPVLRIDTKSGVKECSIMTMNGKAYRITVDMGAAELAPALVPVKLEGDSIVNKPVVIDGHEYYIDVYKRQRLRRAQQRPGGGDGLRARKRHPLRPGLCEKQLYWKKLYFCLLYTSRCV